MKSQGDSLEEKYPQHWGKGGDSKRETSTAKRKKGKKNNLIPTPGLTVRARERVVQSLTECDNSTPIFKKDASE